MALGPVMLDIEGLTLTPADRNLLREPAVGGVILFTRNYESPAQLADLVAAIRAVRSPPLLIAADHEGGRVQRFREGFTAVPPMRRIGRQYDSDPDAAAVACQNGGLGCCLRTPGNGYRSCLYALCRSRLGRQRNNRRPGISSQARMWSRSLLSHIVVD